MLNTCLPRTKPPEISAFPLSTPSASLPQSRSSGSLDPHSPSTLEQVYFGVQNTHSGCGISLRSARALPDRSSISPSLPPSLPVPAAAPAGQARGARTDPPGMCRGRHCLTASLNPSFVQRHSSGLQPALTPWLPSKSEEGTDLHRANPPWDTRCVQGHCSGHRGRSVPARAGQRGCAGMASRDLGSDAGPQTGAFAREGIYPGNHPIKPQ